MDTIFIHDLRVQSRVGVWDWEQQLPQTLRLDLEIGLPSDKVFRSGDFADALDYSAVVARVQAFAADHPHKLLERFADALAELIRAEFRASWIRVRVAKLGAMKGVREIGVTVERGRAG